MCIASLSREFYGYYVTSRILFVVLSLSLGVSLKLDEEGVRNVDWMDLVRLTLL